MKGEVGMKRTLAVILGLAFLIACLGSTAAVAAPSKAAGESGKKYDLKYGLKNDTKFEVKTSRTDDAETEMMGNKVLSKTESATDYALKVKSSGKGSTVFELAYKAKSLTIQGQGDTTSVDFSGLIGKVVSFMLSGNGTASDFTGFDVLPAIDIPAQQTKIDQARYILEVKDLFPKLPGKPVAAGDTWTASDIYKEPMSAGASDSLTVTLNETYTFVGPAQKDGIDCLEIRDDYTLSVAGSGKAQGMSLTIDMPGNGTTMIYFAPSRGMFIALEGTSTIKGTAVIQEAAVTIPMSHAYRTASTVVF
jgi:hypothetical protein